MMKALDNPGINGRHAGLSLYELDRGRSKRGLAVVMACAAFWLIVLGLCLHFF
jgi:hypothetical protein